MSAWLTLSLNTALRWPAALPSLARTMVAPSDWRRGSKARVLSMTRMNSTLG